MWIIAFLIKLVYGLKQCLNLDYDVTVFPSTLISRGVQENELEPGKHQMSFLTRKTTWINIPRKKFSESPSFCVWIDFDRCTWRRLSIRGFFFSIKFVYQGFSIFIYRFRAEIKVYEDPILQFTMYSFHKWMFISTLDIII